jgi:hypothetical protein
VQRRRPALGVQSVRVSTPGELAEIVVPGLRDRDRPLVVSVRLDPAP